MFTIPVDDFMQSLEHIGWFVKKRFTQKEMAFWNHVCYYFSFNSLEFPFWSCWFLISLPLPNPLCSSQLCCFLLSWHSFVCQFDDEPFIAAGESAAALPLAPIQKKIVTENLRILIYCLTSDGAWRAAARALSYALSRALLCSRRRQTNHLRQWQKWPDHTKKSRIIKSCCVLI